MPKEKSFNYEDLSKEYHSGKSLKDICDEYKCSNKTIHSAVKFCGGKVDRNSHITIEGVNKVLTKPMKSSDIALKINKEKRAVRSFLIKNKFPFTIDKGDRLQTKIFKRKK